jgi:hypothetical protein
LIKKVRGGKKRGEEKEPLLFSPPLFFSAAGVPLRQLGTR